ncbi:MAG: ABC transporter ATP-binding protein, partial [Candidatus Bathyarchaeia archaeon]
LDLCNQHRIMTMLVDVVKHGDLTAIMTMHDLNLAIRYSDKFILLKDGKIFAAGDHSVITPKNIETVYGLPVDVEKYRNRLVIVPL